MSDVDDMPRELGEAIAKAEEALTRFLAMEAEHGTNNRGDYLLDPYERVLCAERIIRAALPHIFKAAFHGINRSMERWGA